MYKHISAPPPPSSVRVPTSHRPLAQAGSLVTSVSLVHPLRLPLPAPAPHPQSEGSPSENQALPPLTPGPCWGAVPPGLYPGCWGGPHPISALVAQAWAGFVTLLEGWMSRARHACAPAQGSEGSLSHLASPGRIGRHQWGWKGLCCWKGSVFCRGQGRGRGAGRWRVRDRWLADAGAVRADGLGLLPSSAPRAARRGRAGLSPAEPFPTPGCGAVQVGGYAWPPGGPGAPAGESQGSKEPWVSSPWGARLGPLLAPGTC